LKKSAGVYVKIAVQDVINHDHIYLLSAYGMLMLKSSNAEALYGMALLDSSGFHLVALLCSDST